MTLPGRLVGYEVSSNKSNSSSIHAQLATFNNVM